jgi:hypothetical protein
VQARATAVVPKGQYPYLQLSEKRVTMPFVLDRPAAGIEGLSAVAPQT